MSRTKIVCTLGPASATHEGIKALVQAGMNVARINFSHGSHEVHSRTIALVRAVAAELNTPVALLGDLQGPRIRMGKLAAPVELKEGAEVVLVHEDLAADGELPVTYAALVTDVRLGSRILINDGLFELVVTHIQAPRVRARVRHGGKLTSNKGINLPDDDVTAPSLDEKDLADVVFAVENNFDFLALSFVRRPEDIRSLRKLIPRSLLVIAKIEGAQALQGIEGILRETDAVMVARGDLGVELPFEEVPLAQKRIIALANKLSRPVITATQMLESMIEHPRPTRAEASDVANAVLDGTDAVMLSAETAAGAFPTLAVEAMTRIIKEVEAHRDPREHAERRRPSVHHRATSEETIAAATVTAVQMLEAPCAIVFTKSGSSARVVAAQRPPVPMLVLTDSDRTYRQLALVWGVVPALVPHCNTYDEMVTLARAEAVNRGLAKRGDKVIVTAGVPFDVPGTTNVMKVETV